MDAKNNYPGEERTFRAPNELPEPEKGVSFTRNDSSMCRENNNLIIKGGGKIKIEVILKFKTVSTDGLLWIWSNDAPYVWSIYLMSGRINAELSISKDLTFSLFDTIEDVKPRYNDGNYHTIKVSFGRTKIASGTYQLSFSATEMLDKGGDILIGKNVLVTSKYFMMSKGTMCVGGIAKGGEGVKGPQLMSINGCFVSLGIQGNIAQEALNMHDAFMLNSNFIIHRVTPNCAVTKPNQCRLASGEKPAYLHFDVTNLTQNDEETIGVSFVTTSPSGVLFFRRQQTDLNENDSDKMILALEDGRLLFQIAENSFILSPENSVKLNDNKLHNVFVTRSGASYKLRVDDGPETTGESEILPLNEDNIVNNELYVGGVDEIRREDVQLQLSITEQLVGCIVELVYNNKRLDLQKIPHSSLAQNSQCFAS